MTDDKQSFEQEIRSAWSSIADVFGINFHPLYERLKEVDKVLAEKDREIKYLRQYGNKYCTAMADQAMEEGELDDR